MKINKFALSKKWKTAGFTLIELMITIAIIAILASIAIPAYSNYVIRGKIADATGQMSSLRLLMEQFRQDNRTYLNAGGACAIAAPAPTYFGFACAGAANTFTWTATSAAGQGLGAAGAYAFTIDETGTQTTTAYDGTAYAGVAAKPCWWFRGDEC